MSNEIINPQDFSQMADSFWGESNLDNSDFAIPRVILGQPTSEKYESGFFNFNNGVNVKEILGAKLLVPQKTRVLYGGKNQPSRCKSDNSIEPSTFIKNPISSNCMTCPAAIWGDEDPDKIRLAQSIGIDADQIYKPLCAETYNLLMADANWNPFFISFQKTQIKVVQEKLFSRLRAIKKPPYVIQFDMTIDQLSGKGKYYNTAFDNFKDVPQDQQAIGVELYKRYSKIAQEILSKQHEQMDDDHRKSDGIRPVNQTPMPEEYDGPPSFDGSEEIPF